MRLDILMEYLEEIFGSYLLVESKYLRVHKYNWYS